MKNMKKIIYFFFGVMLGGGFNKQTGPILVHIYPPFNNNFMSNIEAIW